MKKISAVLFAAFLLMPNVSFGKDNNQSNFIQKLSQYFDDYYNAINTIDANGNQERLIENIKDLLNQYSLIKETLSSINNLEDLENAINQVLKENKKRVVLFVIPNSEIINCWLGDLVEERNETKNVFGVDLNFSTVSLDNLEIHDYLYFSTQTEEMLDTGTKGNSIYYNLEALRKRAENILGFFSVREKEEYNKRYSPSKLERLRKYLQHKAWGSYYEKLNEEGSNFISQVVESIKDNSLIHELAHLYIKNNPDFNLDINQEEQFAFLYELSFSEIPFDSLDTIAGIYSKGLKSIYYEATENILKGFIKYIQKQQSLDNPEYKNISVRGEFLKDRLQYIYLLTESQIREISNTLLKEFAQGFVSI